MMKTKRGTFVGLFWHKTHQHLKIAAATKTKQTEERLKKNQRLVFKILSDPIFIFKNVSRMFSLQSQIKQNFIFKKLSVVAFYEFERRHLRRRHRL